MKDSTASTTITVLDETDNSILLPVPEIAHNVLLVGKKGEKFAAMIVGIHPRPGFPRPDPFANLDLVAFSLNGVHFAPNIPYGGSGLPQSWQWPLTIQHTPVETLSI